MIPLFDLHCDTLLELFKQGDDSSLSHLHISNEKSKCFSPYIQVTAIWADNRLTDDLAYNEICKCLEHARHMGIKFCLCHSLSSRCFILGIEDARVLNSDINRLYSLYNKGLRVLTLNWRGQSCIGGGWDTDSPLTDFGREIVKECARLGIIIDLSHSSEKVQDEVFQMSVELGITPIYSHSNSYTVCNHKRNISDEHFTRAVRCNGLVGINLCPKFLENDGSADIYSVLNHIDHFLFLGGESTLALGCDFDGTSSLPTGISDISDLPRLYEIIAKKYGDRFANDIFFYNAFNFWSKNSK